MEKKKDVVRVQAKHIRPGIIKYKGKVNKTIRKGLRSMGFNHTPFVFEDGRILLVMYQQGWAFLYTNESSFFEAWSLPE